MIWHAAVKLAYDGRAFMGSQRQPGMRTVESETIEALRRIGAIESAEASRFRFASRTDRGVSALGNVMAFRTSFGRGALLKALNAASSDVMYYAWAEVPDTFSPRRARQRWYRYLLPSDGIDPRAAAEAAALFEGCHDFKGFCRPDGRSTVRTIDSFIVTEGDGVLIADVRGREFLRSMVRRMVAAIAEVGSGQASLAEVSAVLDGAEGGFGLAPPEQLILMDVDHGLEFETMYPPTLRRKVAAYHADAISRIELIDGLRDRIARGDAAHI